MYLNADEISAAKSIITLHNILPEST